MPDEVRVSRTKLSIIIMISFYYYSYARGHFVVYYSGSQTGKVIAVSYMTTQS